MADLFGQNFEGLDRTELLGMIAALMQVAYQCEYSEDWTLADELGSGNYDALSTSTREVILAFDEDAAEDAIGFCTAVLLKLSMQQE